MILILGVTASGKGRLAFDLAQSIDAEIISIDSMKVYRRMDIGTAKPSAEVRAQVRYHLIDIVEPSNSFSVGAFLGAAQPAIEQIKSRGKTVIAVGGTALYIKALLYGLFDELGTDEQIRAELKAQAQAQGLGQLYRQLAEIDPAAAKRIHPNDAKRIIRALEVYRMTGKPISGFQKQWTATSPQNDWTIIGLRRNKLEESKRINARAVKMVDAGLVDEVKALLSEDEPLSEQARCAIGYAEIINHLKDLYTLDQTVELIKKNTRRLAKGQRTWFKTFKNVNWLNLEPEESALQVLRRAQGLLETVL